MDLSTVSGVEAYMGKLKQKVSLVHPLSGGTANFVYRVVLEEPYEGEETLILKYAAPYIAMQKSLPLEQRYPFPVERQDFEVEALRRVQDVIPKHSKVSAPKVYVFDEKDRVILMEDVGAAERDLKTLFLQTEISIPLAQEIGKELGMFLAKFHSWGEGNAKEIVIFGKNTQAKTVSAWAVYGRLVDTLVGQEPLDRLNVSSLNISAEKLATIENIAAEKQAQIMAANDAIVHGDFWPGNIVVVLKNGKFEKLQVLDWEMSKTGVLGLDLGQFCAEMDLLGRFHPEKKEGSKEVIKHFLEAYKEARKDAEITKDMLVHWGAHLIAWTPRVPWGNAAQTGEAVEAGVEMIVTT